MATIATLFLQEPNLKWNPLSHSTIPKIQHLHPPFIRFKFRKISKQLRVKLFSIDCSKNNASTIDYDTLKNEEMFPEMIKKERNPIEIVATNVIKALKALQKPAVAAVLVGLLLMCDPFSALAASGGRVGGSSFSSRSSMSSSRSYSVPRMGSGSGFSYSAPYYGPSPFGGVYVGSAVGGSSLFMIIMGFAVFVLASGFLSDRSEGGVLTATEKTSVLKLQVGLLGMGRSLQTDLNRIAENADTSSSEGLHYVLTETMLALLRHPDYCISAYSSVDVKRSPEEGEKRFNQLSIEERGKFDEETFVNVNNIKKKSTTSQRSTGFSNEYIVITVLVAAEGVHKLPSINNSRDLKEALQKLGSIPSSKTLSRCYGLPRTKMTLYRNKNYLKITLC
ncbi:uncharacterized protein LOC111379199 [Olea europaea subsp. europaea]|uniref:Uncharacterized protein LOC111379199 n=1 Tax=Olea europaea subsp. europaea TaxID=158383 RepID=A0A8S0PST1_OLEEU|nr:uncharacterized protein LOC111379199 [Olea europaea subsp. europaea]